jgi:hypothetical protein
MAANIRHLENPDKLKIYIDLPLPTSDTPGPHLILSENHCMNRQMYRHMDSVSIWTVRKLVEKSNINNKDATNTKPQVVLDDSAS